MHNNFFKGKNHYHIKDEEIYTWEFALFFQKNKW